MDGAYAEVSKLTERRAVDSQMSITISVHLHLDRCPTDLIRVPTSTSMATKTGEEVAWRLPTMSESQSKMPLLDVSDTPSNPKAYI